MLSYKKYLKYKLKYLNLKQLAGAHAEPTNNAAILLFFYHNNEYKAIFVIENNNDNEIGTPGGGIEPGESPEDAMKREFDEEIGMDLPPLENEDNYEIYYNPDNGNTTYIYISSLKNSSDKITFIKSKNNETKGVVNLSFNKLVDDILFGETQFTDTRGNLHSIREPIKKSLKHLLYQGKLNRYITDRRILSKLKENGNYRVAPAGAVPARAVPVNLLQFTGGIYLGEPLSVKLNKLDSTNRRKSRCLDKTTLLYKILANSIVNLIKTTKYEHLTFYMGLHVEIKNVSGALKFPEINLEDNNYYINKFNVVISTSNKAIGLLLQDIPPGQSYKDTYHITILHSDSGFTERDRRAVENALLTELSTYKRERRNYNLNPNVSAYKAKITGTTCK